MSKILEKNNSAWDMYSIDLEKNTIYNIFTKAWNYRWWKSYLNDKKLIILSGKIKLISNIWWEDKEEIFYAWNVIDIKYWIPHILYFLEDSEIIEYFPKDTKTEKYERFYNLKK